MKLSDVKGERTFDVIADITGPIANISQDDDAMAMFRPQGVPDGMDRKKFIANRVSKGAPALLKKHKKDVIKILASIEGVSTKKYVESLNLAKLLKDVIELMTDEAILDFLTPSANGPESSDTVLDLTLVQGGRTPLQDTSMDDSAEK